MVGHILYKIQTVIKVNNNAIYFIHVSSHAGIKSNDMTDDPSNKARNFPNITYNCKNDMGDLRRLARKFEFKIHMQ